MKRPVARAIVCGPAMAGTEDLWQEVSVVTMFWFRLPV